MKAHGKGKGISINEPNLGGTSTVNAFKMRMEAQTWGDSPVPVFRPLVSWPAKPHERQAEIDQFKAIPSRYL